MRWEHLVTNPKAWFVAAILACLIVALCIWGCTAKAAMGVQSAGRDLDKSRTATTTPTASAETEGQKGSNYILNLTFGESVIGGVVLIGALGGLGLIALRWRKLSMSQARAVHDMDKPSPGLAGHVAAMVKQRVPEGLRPMFKRVLKRHDLYVTPAKTESLRQKELIN